MESTGSGLIGGLTIPEFIWYALIAVLSFSIVLTSIYIWLRGGRQKSEDLLDTVFVECASCMWKGDVPRLRKRCPVCGANNFTT